MAHVPARLRSFVATRSLQSCEYCLVHADYAAFAHEVDHVIALKHGVPDQHTRRVMYELFRRQLFHAVGQT